MPPSKRSAWKLLSCATNKRRWDTGSLVWCARHDNLLAVNARGTVRLFDIADAEDVRPLGKLAIAELDGDEDFPLGFHDGALVQAHDGGLVVIDVAKPNAPKIVARHAGAPRRRPGQLVGDVYYAGSPDKDGVFAQRIGGKVIAFSPERSRHLPPSAFAHVAPDLLYVITPNEVEVHRLVDGVPVAGSTAIKSKKIDTGATCTVYTAPNGLVAIAPTIANSGVRVVDPARPANPKVQRRVFEAELYGHGIDGNTLVVASGAFEEHITLTRIALRRPTSAPGKPRLLTEDPELAGGLAFLDLRGDDVLVLARTGRFALLRAS